MSLFTKFRDALNPFKNGLDPGWSFLQQATGLSGIGSPFISAISGGTSIFLQPHHLQSDWRKFKHWLIPDVRQDREVTTIGPQTARRIVYGRAKVGGQLVYAETSGTNNKTMNMVIVLAGHPCEEVEDLFLDGVSITDAKYSSVASYLAFLGDQTEAAATLVALPSGNWTAAHKLLGCTYVHLTMTYSDGKFPSGIPSISAVVKGKKVYDPRSAATAWSANAALCVRDYMLLSRPLGGMGCLSGEVDEDLLAAAADICDELVAADGGSGLENRYTCNGTVDLSALPLDVLDALLSAMDGTRVYAGGVWKIYAGAPISEWVQVDESWLNGGFSFSRGDKSGKINTIKATYIDPAENYAVKDLPPLSDASYIEEDGGEELIENLPLNYTASSAGAQRMAQITLRRSRKGLSVKYPCNLKALRLEPNMGIRLCNDRLGWVDKEFRLVDWAFSLTGGIDLALAEEDSTIYNWGTSNYTATTTPGDAGVVDQVPGGTTTQDIADGIAADTGGITIGGTATLQSADYTAGTSGWSLNGDGTAELIAPSFGQMKITPEGGIAVLLTNLTGSASVKGTLVKASSTSGGVAVNPADIPVAFGVIYENDVADGDPVWVVISGMADVLLEDGTAATAGYWAKVSDSQDGRADITNAYPPGGTITALDDHLSEIGHCLQTVSSGTDRLCRVTLHFN